MWHVLHTAWDLTKQSVVVFIDEGALNRGAAIAFYAITSTGPILLIVVAVVGVVYGEQVALHAIWNVTPESVTVWGWCQAWPWCRS